MIVPMKKVTLISLRSEEEDALKELRTLGVMQIELASGKISDRTLQCEESAENSRRITAALQKIAEEQQIAPEKANAGNAGELEHEAAALLAQKEELSAKLAALQARRKELAVWGDFRTGTLQELQNSGVCVKLCAANPAEYEKLSQREDVTLFPVEKTPHKIFFAAVSLQELPAGNLPEVRINEADDSETLQQNIRETGDLLTAAEKRLHKLVPFLDAMRAETAKREKALEFARVFDSLAEHGELSSLTGFVPVPDVAQIEAAAQKFGWALLIEDPAPGDKVPTLLKTPAWVKAVDPLFRFLGITPGYDEMDVSAGVFVFFTIFYAIILGDAGYGCLFLAATLFGYWKFRNKPAAKLPLRLLLILSLATILWGALTGNWFGTGVFPGIDCFTNAATKDANTQAFCFILAIAQLSLGRIWRACHDGSWKSWGRNLGWTLILWGNFFLTLKLIVWPGAFPVYMYYLYGAGLALVLVCDLDWRSPADIFQFPFNVIGSFVDVLSYIRLFAVGMAGFYIASSFNGMGEQIYKASPWFVLGAAIVILFGHALNIGLNIMSVLVHAVRLNTLEFSNHVNLRWSGNSFKPFTDNNNQEEK